MDFRQRLEELLKAAPRDSTGDKSGLSESDIQAISLALKEVTGLLREVKPSLPGSTVTPEGKDRLDPAFYISSLRIPQIHELGFSSPVRLYFMVNPVLGSPFTIKLIRAIVIGRATQMMSLRRFLRAWHLAGTGGVVVYEGEPDASRVRIAGEQAIFRFFERRSELMAGANRGVGHQAQVWPIDPNFKPRLCSNCLLPVPYGGRCISCLEWPKGSTEVQKQPAPKPAPSERPTLIRFTTQSGEVYRGVVLRRVGATVRARVKGALESQPGGETTVTMEDQSGLKRHRAGIQSYVIKGNQTTVSLLLKGEPDDG